MKKRDKQKNRLDYLKLLTIRLNFTVHVCMYVWMYCPLYSTVE